MSVICRSAGGSPPGKSTSGLTLLIMASLSCWRSRIYRDPVEGSRERRGEPGSGQHLGRQAGLRLRLRDVDQPGDAEPVREHAELVAPDLLLQRHRHGPAVGELLPVAAQGL